MYKEGSTINIMGIPHTIALREDAFNDNLHFGQIAYAEAKITLNGKLNDQLMAETLTHEVLHGIFVHMGREDLSNDETFVQGLANALSQSFRPVVRMPAGTTARRGPYEKSDSSLRDNGYDRNDPAWEEFLSDCGRQSKDDH